VVLLRSRAGRPVLLVLAALLLCAGLTTEARAADRPKVGLVLGGGGARGAAHIGVLEALEALRVPVDCVAGTSMGALVAGAWVAGMDAATMRRELAAADWNDMFQDNPGYNEFNVRNKRLAQRYLPGSETGITPRGAETPPGVVTGQKIKLFFNQLVRADAGERAIETLPLPLALVATDIGTGERVLLRDGSLSMAMRASMSVPGLMAPLEYRGRKLVDGMLVDNLPVQAVRELCGAEVVIAVNVGSPLAAPEQVTGLLSVFGQMVNILSEQNVTQSLARLGPGDIYIKPALQGVTAGDFQRNGEVADMGRVAAMASADALRRLAVDGVTYAAYRQRLARPLDHPARVDEIQVADMKNVNPATLSRYLNQQVGQPLDASALNKSLLRAYGDGNYQQVDYSLLRQHERNVLRITPVEKSWGPDYLRLGLNLNTTLRAGSTYALRAAYQKTWLNALGGELLFTADLGSETGVGVDWYQPLDATQRFFVEAEAAVRSERVPVYIKDLRVSEYNNRVSLVDLAAGINLGVFGRARLGWREQRNDLSVETGQAILPGDALRSSGVMADLQLDQLNRLYLPTAGWALRLGLFESAREDYDRLSMKLDLATPLGPWVVGVRLKYDGSIHGQLPLQALVPLGGFLNLSGYASGQLLGDKVQYGHVRFERIIGRMPLGLTGDMRLGLALEAARMGRPVSVQGSSRSLDSAALYLGGETPFGPVFLGLGYSTQGYSNVYLSVGVP
jgi:NTE family protein